MSLFALGAASGIAGLYLVRWMGARLVDVLFSDELTRWNEEHHRYQ